MWEMFWISRRSFKSYQYNSSESEEHQCETCGKWFGYQGDLLRHLKTIYLTQKDDKCETCGKRFG